VRPFVEDGRRVLSAWSSAFRRQVAHPYTNPLKAELITFALARHHSSLAICFAQCRGNDLTFQSFNNMTISDYAIA
jgi:hypothetical protein